MEESSEPNTSSTSPHSTEHPLSAPSSSMPASSSGSQRFHPLVFINIPPFTQCPADPPPVFDASIPHFSHSGQAKGIIYRAEVCGAVSELEGQMPKRAPRFGRDALVFVFMR